MDQSAYSAYKKTKAYQGNEAKAKSELQNKVKINFVQQSHIVNWSVTMKPLKELTGPWAHLSAIAKGYHSDYLYAILSLSLLDKNHNVVFTSKGIKRKIYFDKEHTVHVSTPYPKNLVFSSGKVNIDLDLKASKLEYKKSIATSSKNIVQSKKLSPPEKIKNMTFDEYKAYAKTEEYKNFFGKKSSANHVKTNKYKNISSKSRKPMQNNLKYSIRKKRIDLKGGDVRLASTPRYKQLTIELALSGNYPTKQQAKELLTNVLNDTIKPIMLMQLQSFYIQAYHQVMGLVELNGGLKVIA